MDDYLRILFITSTRIGDAVLSTGVLAHLIDRHPGAEITVACGPVVAPLFEAMPEVAEVIALKKQKMAGHWVQLWRRTVGRYWTIVVDLRGSGLNWFLLAGRRYVAGRSKGTVHKVVTLSNALNVDPPASPRIRLHDFYRAKADAILKTDGPFLAICPTANWIGKRWPEDRFVDLVRKLTTAGGLFETSTIVVFGGPGEEDMAAEVLDGLEDKSPLNLVGKLDLPTAYACLARCQFFIGNDSGLMHLSAAAGVPTLGVFGPSPDNLYAPWGEDCMVVRNETYDAIVNNPEFDHRKPVSYMGSLTVGQVQAATEDLFQKVQQKKETT